jgi:DNA helicase-2/ATP-dependent DNA helicase PcrA
MESDVVAGYRSDQIAETEYLEKTLAFIRAELTAGAEATKTKKRRMVASRREMWENTVHYVDDFTRLTEMSQYLSELNNQTADYGAALKKLDRYEKILGSPYFGRFDFRETGANENEKFYIGLANVVDADNFLVYDWRAPICGLFYQYEPGLVAYQAPAGTISGEMSLKRQYQIKGSQLIYFFDCSVCIDDEILQEVLSRNASPKMRNIVETIQKEQDVIIRDTENDLLIVQGVAGSGKTSIALHRIAFLLYHGINNIGSTNFLIISPNDVFSNYISSVLPELGEENVEQITFDEIVRQQFRGRLTTETRNERLESLIDAPSPSEMVVRSQSVEFKSSRVFVEIIDRLINHYERQVLEFTDLYYDGQVLFSRQQLKTLFLQRRGSIPMIRRLKRIENLVLDKFHPLQKARLEKIRQIVDRNDGHELEVKSYSRLLSMKEAKVFRERVRRFTEVDYLQVYRLLFQEPGLFYKLARGLDLPEQIEQIIFRTSARLKKGHLNYEDCAPLLYLKLRLEGSDLTGIKQVVIDEAQDYYPVHYEIFSLLFRNARYTVLGDVNQTVEREADISLYHDITEILNKGRTVSLFLNKGYRSSYEINTFSGALLGREQELLSFERHEEQPAVVQSLDQQQLDQAIVRDIESYLKQGFTSVAVLCKTEREASGLRARIRGLTTIDLMSDFDGEMAGRALVIPAYMAKGLEFDVVLVPGVSAVNYSNDLDRRLLYIACTRALHRLALYYTGEISPLIACKVPKN